MVSDLPMSKQTNEQSGVKRASGAKRSKADCSGVNEQLSGALWSKRVRERVALLNDAVFCIIDHSASILLTRPKKDGSQISSSEPPKFFDDSSGAEGLKRINANSWQNKKPFAHSRDC